MSTPLLRIYSRIPQDWNASIYYRILLPARTMFKEGLCDLSIDRGTVDLNQEERNRLASHSSINWFYQPTHPAVAASCDEVRKWPSYWMNEELWDVAPHFVMDTDDDIFNVTPDNPAYSNLGINVNEQPLEKGGAIIADNEDGTKTVAYKDGERGFSLDTNHERLNAWRDALQRCDLVTCSTPSVREYVLREAPEARTLILPNCIDFDDYPQGIEFAKRDRVRILWQGAPNHSPELWAIKDALKSIHDKYPETDFVFFGAIYDWMRAFDPDRTQLLKWCDYPEYKLRLSLLNHDINLAPLAPTLFNSRRSAIRFYEAAAISKPACTLAQRVAAFPDEIIEGETGYLFSDSDEFEQKLALLVEDRGARETAASNAKQWVRENRDPVKWAYVASEAFEKLRLGRRSMVGEPPRPIEVPTDGTIPAEQPDLRER